MLKPNMEMENNDSVLSRAPCPARNTRFARRPSAVPFKATRAMSRAHAARAGYNSRRRNNSACERRRGGGENDAETARCRVDLVARTRSLQALPEHTVGTSCLAIGADRRRVDAASGHSAANGIARDMRPAKWRKPLPLSSKNARGWRTGETSQEQHS